jgi:hypothetical protein
MSKIATIAVLVLFLGYFLMAFLGFFLNNTPRLNSFKTEIDPHSQYEAPDMAIAFIYG